MKKIQSDKKTVRRILSLLSTYKTYFVATILFAALFVAFSLYVPVLVGKAIDCIAGPGAVDFKGLWRQLLLILIFASSAALSQWLMGRVNNAITYNVIRDIRKEAFDRLLRVPVSFIDSQPQGNIVSRVITDVDTFADGLLLGFTQFFTGALTIIGTLCIMASLDYRVCLVVVLLTPLSLFAARWIARHSFSAFVKQSDTRAEQTAFIDETVSGLQVVKAFSCENSVQERFEEINNRLAKHAFHATFYSSLTNPTTRFINNFVYLVVALIGAFTVIGGGFSIGVLVALLSYANQYTKPFNDISGVITELQNAVACAGRVFQLIDEKEQSPDGTKTLNDHDASVAFEHVDFSYTKKARLIEDLNVSVEKGMKAAIVGPTGCGKTTLINLLMRFYDADGGRITVDGINVCDLQRKELRSAFGMVLQETWLKSGTVRENLKMGKPDATDEEMFAAAKEMHAEEVVRRLQNGYDTVITENGGDLSEGQKQLLCITRALLMDPPMLILDEATSSIDTRTERLIQDAFDKLMKGKTTFIIAHRLSTIRDADVILVMKDGRICEQGKHEELLAKKGFYYKLYNSQFEKS